MSRSREVTDETIVPNIAFPCASTTRGPSAISADHAGVGAITVGEVSR
jgi:hypothetical protein